MALLKPGASLLLSSGRYRFRSWTGIAARQGWVRGVRGARGFLGGTCLDVSSANRQSKADGARALTATVQAMEHKSAEDVGEHAIADAFAGGLLAGEHIWPKVVSTYSEACQSGAISKIDCTVSTLVEDVGGTEVPWVLRLAAILKKKPTAAASPSTLSAGEFKGKPVFINPFDPPEKALTVGHLSDTHTLVLNKFNVVEHHIIVITRTFQLQTDPLNKHDLDAAYAVLRSMPEGGLAFFNCGNHSGRSQPHKHVQIVPLPLLDGQPAAPPTAAVILGDAAGKPDFEVTETRSFPFRGYCCKLSRGATADQLETAFHDLLHAASASTQQDEPLSYNWLGCEDFMALFPRSQEKVEVLPVNALGFAGTFLCRSDDEIDFAKTMGCVNILKAVGQSCFLMAAHESETSRLTEVNVVV